MQIVTVQSTATPATSAAQYPPLDQETRSHIPTAPAAYYLNRKPQTLRIWAVYEQKCGIKPVRINGRLAWPVAAIRALLEGGA